jgi:hypothetical protein
MNKAPDTRNKLDSNVGIKKRKKKETRFTMSEFKEVAPLVKLGISPETTKRKPKKLTKGEEFKLKFGFSKSMARAMRRNGITVPKVVVGYGTEVIYAYKNYIALRKEKKAEAKAAKRKPISNSKVVEPTKTKKKK